MITDHELDATLRRFFAEEAARVERSAPSIEHAVARLLPRVERQLAREDLLLVLAAALLLSAPWPLRSPSVKGCSHGRRTAAADPRRTVPAYRDAPAGAGPQALVAQQDGSALLVGGQMLFRFDPETGRFAEVGSLQIPRTLPATVVLADGRVLIVGGGLTWCPVSQWMAITLRFTTLYLEPQASRDRPFIPGLGDGDPARRRPRSVAGGSAQGFARTTAEIFDPQTGDFSETGSMSRPRSDRPAVCSATAAS